MTIAVSGDNARAGLLRFTDFFEGEATAWGVFVDVFGVVRQHLAVQLTGSWHGSRFHLDEVFDYGTGERETRQWVVQDIDNVTFRASFPDCVGPVNGTNGGDGIRMTYAYNLPLGGRHLVVSVDDRMHKVGPTRVFNRAAMKKFGVTLGHVLLFIEKTESKPKGAAG